MPVPSTKETEAGGSEIQEFPWLYSKFEAGMGYMRSNWEEWGGRREEESPQKTWATWDPCYRVHLERDRFPQGTPSGSVCPIHSSDTWVSLSSNHFDLAPWSPQPPPADTKWSSLDTRCLHSQVLTQWQLHEQKNKCGSCFKPLTFYIAINHLCRKAVFLYLIRGFFF